MTDIHTYGPTDRKRLIESRSTRLKKIYAYDFCYQAIGYALGNSIMIEGKEGIVIIDTTESLTAAKYERDTDRESYIQCRECGVIMDTTNLLVRDHEW